MRTTMTVVEHAGVTRNKWKSLFNDRLDSNNKPLYCFRVSIALVLFSVMLNLLNRRIYDYLSFHYFCFDDKPAQYKNKEL